MTTDLLTRLRDHVAAADVFPEPGLALLAVSGGPDSLAMLDLLSRLGPAWGLDVALAHVDHGILPDSGDVAEQVLGIAARYGVPGHLRSLRLGARASETAARRARYGALRALQAAVGARYLVTAHHADDQIETVLFRLLRGSGLSGLSGMAAVGPGGLVRPLLPFRKRELRAWVEAPGGEVGPLPVHEDPGNVALRHDRSWIRWRLLPMLVARFGPAAEDRLLTAARHAGRDRSAWAGVLERLPGLDVRRDGEWIEVARAPLEEYDEPLIHALLSVLAREAGFVLGPTRAARTWASIAGSQSGKTFELGRGWVVETVFGRLRIGRRRETLPEPSGMTLQLTRDAAGRVRWGRWVVAWRREPAGTLERGGWSTWTAIDDVTIRTPRPGQRLRPLGSRVTRPVSTLLMEGRVPRSERSTHPVLWRGGEILWLPGVCRAAAAAPDPGTMAVRLDVSLSRDP